jgi:serine/threonine-protein kinase
LRRLLFFLTYGMAALGVAALGGYLVVAFLVERAPEVEVPAVVGLELADALDRVNQQQLDLEVRGFVYSDSVEQNRVVHQRPQTGKIVKAGRGVGVMLSRGPERHAMPSVVGQSLTDATIALTQAGMTPEVTARIHGEREDMVMGQSTAPGTRLPAGTSVALLVSEGPRPTRLRMPRLEGTMLTQAEGVLAAMGLRMERVEEIKLGDTARAGHVVSQDPLPGFPIERGAGVTLSVASGAKPAARGSAVWVERYMPEGYTRHKVEVFIESDGERRLAVEQWVDGGETFRHMVSLRPGEKTIVHVDGKPD